MAEEQHKRARISGFLLLVVLASVILVLAVRHGRDRQSPVVQQLPGAQESAGAGESSTLGDGTYELRTDLDESLSLYDRNLKQTVINGIGSYRAVDDKLFVVTDDQLAIVNLSIHTIAAYSGIEDVDPDEADIFRLMGVPGGSEYPSSEGSCAPSG